MPVLSSGTAGGHCGRGEYASASRRMSHDVRLVQACTGPVEVVFAATAVGQRNAASLEETRLQLCGRVGRCTLECRVVEEYGNGNGRGSDVRMEKEIVACGRFREGTDRQRG